MKEVTKIDASDIKAYVIDMQIIQIKLRYIDTTRDHFESKLAAHMTRLPENLIEEQTKDIQYYRKEKWLNRENATKKNAFLI